MQVTETKRTTGQGFCLVMRLANPARLPELLGVIDAKYATGIDEQLQRLKYVHYSRFVPIFDRGVLLIVTEFDGVQEDYVMDFATVLDEEFSFILSYMEGAPRLPVSRYPDEFYDYVARNAKLFPPPIDDRRPFSAYQSKSVLDIVGDTVFAAHAEAIEKAARADAKKAAATPPVEPSAQENQVTWSEEVQANVVQGLRALHALHVGLSFKSAKGGQSVLAALAKVVTWQDEAAAAIAAAPREKAAALAVNVGLTHDGLAALEVPAGILRRFPEAYRVGPANRRERLGDLGESAAEHWLVGKPDASAPLHAVLSLWVEEGTAGALHDRVTALLKPFAGDAIQIFEQPASRFAKDDDTVHFGYRDSISQPRIEGVTYKNESSAPGRIPVGDILLGPSYRNSRGSSPIADLPIALAQNSTYAALRVIEQHVDAFEQMLAKPDIDPPLPEDLDEEHAAGLIAAKLLGRWRNGMPLTAGNEGKAPPVPRGGDVDNDFDFWKSPSEADRSGSGCPFGSHIRRMNPRAGVVVGIPQGRRIIRRAMPYGPQKGDSAETPRGLVGLFFCADLANQFEFIQHAWANGDVSAPGLARSVDPIIGARDETGGTRFVFDHAGKTYTLKVPRLTTIRGSAYLLMPSKTALNWLATAGWKARARDMPSATQTPAPIVSDAPGAFNVGDRRFAQMPHRFYAHWRKQSVLFVGPPYNAQWVLSYAAVKEALQQETVFLKPGKDRGVPRPSPFAVTAQLDDGLFFQDLATHKELKTCLRPRFDEVASEAKVYRLARVKAEELLNAAVAKGVFDIVSEYAVPLTTHVFMSLALPPATDPRADPRALLDTWVRKALMGHSENAPLAERLEGGSASFALRGWLHAFLQGDLSSETIFGAIKGCPARSGDVMTNSALHFALGGYLSTEFLITTGVYNLLTTGQWRALGDDRDLMGSAIEEMLRFDAPFMMADRWIKDETTLAGHKLAARSNVTLVYGAANRDPDVFTDPDRFDIKRFSKSNPKPAPSHFGFGWGEYDCIGQHLARWTASVAFNCLLDRFPDAQLGEVGPWISDPYYRSLKRLTLTV